MKKKLYVIFIIFIAISCNNKTDSDKIISELANQAIEHRMDGELEKAKEFYFQAIEIDNTIPSLYYDIITIYVQQDSLDKAFGFLEKLPKELKKQSYFYQIKGNLFEYTEQKEKANENYKKAFELTDPVKISNEMDLGKLVNYTLLQTLAGEKKQAVRRLNEALNLNWLTYSNKEYLERFRNEFEYYQGNGFSELDPKNDITIKTTNSDSLKSILKENHINISGSSSNNGNDSTEIYISEKYRSGLEKLNIKNAP